MVHQERFSLPTSVSLKWCLFLNFHFFMVNKESDISVLFKKHIVLHVVLRIYLKWLFLIGKFYTLTTGANERRWGRLKDKLRIVADSFSILVWVSFTWWSQVSISVLYWLAYLGYCISFFIHRCTLTHNFIFHYAGLFYPHLCMLIVQKLH